MSGIGTLQQAVEAQARARVAGDVTSFASFFTPQALATLHQMAPVRPKAFEVLAVVASGTTGSSDVVYRGRDAHVLAQRWQVLDGVWTAVEVERLRAPGRSWWKRIAARFGRAPMTEGADGEAA